MSTSRTSRRRRQSMWRNWPQRGSDGWLSIYEYSICMYVYVCRCMYACMSVCMHVCVYVCIHTYIHTYIYIYMFYVCAYTGVFAHEYAYLCVCVCVYTYICIYVCIYIYIYLDRYSTFALLHKCVESIGTVRCKSICVHRSLLPTYKHTQRRVSTLTLWQV